MLSKGKVVEAIDANLFATARPRSICRLMFADNIDVKYSPGEQCGIDCPCGDSKFQNRIKKEALQGKKSIVLI